MTTPPGIETTEPLPHDGEDPEERRAMIEGVVRGEAAVLASRIHTHADARVHMARWLEHREA